MEKKDFFISYNKADKAWAKWIAGVLEENGYSIYLQAWDIRPGDDFMMARMNEFLENSMGYISVFSQDFKDSPYCQLELSAALDKHLKDPAYLFLLVRVAKIAPPDLVRTVVYIDLFGADEVTAKKRLLNAVDQKPIPRKLSPFPGDNVGSPFPAPIRNHNLPDSNPHFTGREDILNEMHREFQSGQAVSLRQTIAGLGGVGKTQTAIEYAYRHANDYDVIWWVNAETGLYEAYHAFAQRMKLLPVGESTTEQIVQQVVKEWLDTHGRFLFIFDNVEDFDALRDYLPRNTGQVNGHVLLTTRNRKLNILYAKPVELDVFTENEARDLMLKLLAVNEKAIGNQKILDELNKRLGYLPLALMQAAAYIANTDNNCDCRDYLSLLEQHGLEVLKDEATKPVDYHAIVTTTWEISFGKLSKAAQQLFYLCAYMSPDDIPLDIFVQQSKSLPAPLRDELDSVPTTNKVIQSLTKYALAKRTGGFLSIHRLVQEVVRDSLRSDTTFLDAVFRMMAGAIPCEYGNDRAARDLFRRIAAHAFAIADHFAAVHNDKDSQELAAALFFEVGRGHQDVTCRYHLALSACRRSVAIYEKVLGKEHPSTAAMYNNIGVVYKEQGDYDKALEWHLKALAISEKVLGKEHPDTAGTYNNIAVVYKNQGKYDEALKWYQKALAIKEKVLGKEHPSTAATYNNIAIVYRKQGKYEQALEKYQKALAIREKVLGKEHPDTAATYNNIGEVYRNQGDNEQALVWYHKALPIFEKVLGKEHPSTATTYNNIGEVYRNQGKYEQALEWYQKALAIREKVLGKEHPDTALTYNNIGLVYEEQGKYVEALEWHEKALAIRERVLGKEHPDAAATYNNIAIVYRKQGKYEQALEKYQKALAIREKVLGKEHPDTAMTYNNIANVYDDLDDYEQALEWYHKALAVFETVFGEDHPHTKGVRDNIADTRKRMGDA
ncbi:MAG: DUF2225 domain-containing protein, partial [Planctomycetaceae bacterium]|nr:DUF2225 domain-containing protein [Planctomycetaceae bacterium]